VGKKFVGVLPPNSKQNGTADVKRGSVGRARRGKREGFGGEGGVPHS